MQYRKDKKSPWVVQYRIPTGANRGKIATRSFLKKEDAEAFEISLARTKQLMRAGLDAPREAILLIDYAKNWIRQRQADGNASVNHDASRLKNYWLPEFGLRPLQTMTAAEIKARLDFIQYEKNHTTADRNRHRALLHKLFQDALMDDKVVFNPVSKIPLKEEKSNRPKVVLTDEEQRLWLDGLAKEGQQYWMIGQLLLWTGARICTANVVQYQDIDFDTGVIRLRRIEDRATGQVVARQKGGSETLVPLFPVLRSAILAHREKTIFIRPTDYVACHDDGRYVPYDTWKDVLQRAITNQGIRRFTSHDLRRTFATNAKKAGYTRAEIREMLGHSSELVTGRYDLEDIEHLVEKGRRLGFGTDGTVKIRKRGKRA